VEDEGLAAIRLKLFRLHKAIFGQPWQIPASSHCCTASNSSICGTGELHDGAAGSEVDGGRATGGASAQLVDEFDHGRCQDKPGAARCFRAR
jgi:hypothetical protein